MKRIADESDGAITMTDTLLNAVELLLEIWFLGLALVAAAALVAWQWISDWRASWVTRVSLVISLLGVVAFIWLSRSVTLSPGQSVIAMLLFVIVMVGSTARFESWLKSRFPQNNP